MIDSAERISDARILEVALTAIEGSLGATDLEIATLQLQTFFLSTYSTPFGIPTKVYTGIQEPESNPR